MESAESWSKNIAGTEPGFPCHVHAIEQIQLDAVKEGMRRACELARIINDGHDWPVTRLIDMAIEKTRVEDLKEWTSKPSTVDRIDLFLKY